MIDTAFKEGIRLIRESGIDTDGLRVPLLAAYFAFEKRCKGKEHDPRFPSEAPLFAKRCILDAIIIHTK